MEELKLQEQIKRAKAELRILYEIGNAMRTTLNLDEVLYIILTGATCHEGLGFNRAILFLVNNNNTFLDGKMGIGPQSGEEAERIWTDIEESKMTFEDLVGAYKNFGKGADSLDSQLNSVIKNIKIPLQEAGGIIALTALEGMAFELTSNEARAKINDPILTQLNVNHCVTMPLKAKDKTLGVLLADNIVTKKPITKDDIRILNLFANHAGLAIENSRLYEQTLLLSYTDFLTRLWNHGYFQAELIKHLEETAKNNTTLSLIMLDIDDFKNYNDTLGHQAGDLILKETAKILKENIRKKDTVARYGGEEFCIILPNTDKPAAENISENVREVIKNYFSNKRDPVGFSNITISAGVASFPLDAKDKHELILKADLALYTAKKNGKNRTCSYQTTQHL